MVAQAQVAEVAETEQVVEIEIDPESEAGKKLAAAGDRRIVLVSGGHRFRVLRGAGAAGQADPDESTDREDPFANYDPERALAAWQGTFGILKELDIETFKAEMREARGQDREGTF